MPLDPTTAHSHLRLVSVSSPDFKDHPCVDRVEFSPPVHAFHPASVAYLWRHHE
jgi:hypothetical protein